MKQGTKHVSYKCPHCGKMSSMKGESEAGEDPKEEATETPAQEAAEQDDPVMSAKKKVKSMLADFDKRDQTAGSLDVNHGNPRTKGKLDVYSGKARTKGSLRADKHLKGKV